MPRRGDPAPVDAHDDTIPARSRHGEKLALAALLLPWIVLSLLLPLPHMIAALAMIAALGALVCVAVRWSRWRAAELGLDADAWALAAVLSLGYSQLLLLGAKGRSGYEAMCDECGKLNDARETFCYGCGALG